MNTRPQQPAVPPSMEDHYELVSEAQDTIGHYLSIAKSCEAIRDSQMLEEAARKLELSAIHHSKAVRMLLAAIAADKRLGDFCRGTTTGNDRHDG